MYTLQGEHQHIAFSDTGCVLSFTDPSLSRNYIAAPAPGRPLFRIGCTEFLQGERQPGNIILTSDLTMPFVEQDKNRITFRYSFLGGRNIHVSCHVHMDPADGLCHFSIHIENHSTLGLHFLEYPVIECPVFLGQDPSQSRILLPKQDGYLLPSPHYHPWEGDLPFRSFDQRFEYPGNGREFPENISAQLLAYYDPEGGFYLAVHDGGGNPKRLGPVWNRNASVETLSFTPFFHLPPVSGNSYNPGYEVVICCFHGGWQSAADLYKKFAEKQSWCSKKLWEREDIPLWVKKGALFFNIRLRGQENGFPDELPEYLKDWQQYWNVPMAAMMCGWEKHGEWVGPDYFPPYGGERRFRQLCTSLKQEKIFPFPFGLSGLKLPIRKLIGADHPQPELVIDYDNREYFQKILSPAAATDAAGQFITDSEPSDWDGLHAYACVSTNQARNQLYGAAMELVSLGAQIVQADQLFGGGVTECFQTSHGHPPGRGKWQTEQLAAIYDAIRRDGKKQDPDFVLSQEFMSELFIQHLDICHARVFDEPRGIGGIPLFAYLYHEYMPCYGGDWSSQLSDNTCGIYNHAANFVYGSLPAACPQTMMKSMINEPLSNCDPSILKMGKNCCSLHCRFPQYLINGKMLPFSELPVPRITVSYTGLNFSGWKKGNGQQPAVLFCRWEAPDKSRACVCANISSHTQTFPIAFPPSVKEAVLWRNDEPMKRLRITDGISMVSLLPQDAAVIEELRPNL